MKKTAIIFAVALVAVLFTALSLAGQENKHHGIWAAHSRVGQVDRSRGQLLYVPTAYLNLSNAGVYQYAFSRVVIRNLDPFSSIRVNSAIFHDQEGLYDPVDLLEGEDELPVVIEAFKSKTLAIGSNLAGKVPFGDVNKGRSYVLLDWDAEEKVITPSIGSIVGIIRVFDLGHTYEAMIEKSGTVLEEK